ncbi:protein TIFY 6B-like isoform X2 [Malus domestica]|uniref:protein TIFY 6B-like isoform X2 n=1 Tax=Malus domestica TaxID=3750 RepID=UPI0010AA1B9F|nr:protein TIFY 6B-like isoform X2 [Malus domestica]
MERDFLGLSSNNGCVTLKEETNDEAKNSAVPRSSGMQWSFSNKVSALPQFLSFKAPQEGRPRKAVHHNTSAFMTISTADAFHSSQKSFSGVIQFDAHLVHHSQIPITLSSPVLQSHAPVGNNGSTIKLQSLGGVPVLSPVSAHPSTTSVVGTTDLRNASKSAGAPAQLTIFYAGSVNVYNDISPEKAQAIMLLAGDGLSPTHCKSPSVAQVHAPIPGPSLGGDGFFGNQSHIKCSVSALPSPLFATSHGGSHVGGTFNSTNELAIVKPASPIDRSEPSPVVSSVGSAMTNLIPAVPVPQARKASLARFFEKRKERMTSTAPYNVSGKSPDRSMPGSQGLSFSFNSSGSCPPQATN